MDVKELVDIQNKIIVWNKYQIPRSDVLKNFHIPLNFTIP